MTPFLSGLGGNSAIPRRLEANRRLPRQEHSPAASLPLTVRRAGEPLGFVLLSPSALPTAPFPAGGAGPAAAPLGAAPRPGHAPGGGGQAAPRRAEPCRPPPPSASRRSCRERVPAAAQRREGEGKEAEGAAAALRGAGAVRSRRRRRRVRAARRGGSGARPGPRPGAGGR